MYRQRDGAGAKEPSSRAELLVRVGAEMGHHSPAGFVEEDDGVRVGDQGAVAVEFDGLGDPGCVVYIGVRGEVSDGIGCVDDEEGARGCVEGCYRVG